MTTLKGGKLFPPKFIASVIFPVRDGQVCMAIKTRGIGKTKRNGYGGGKEDYDANMIACSIREFKDESLAVAKAEDLRQVGFIEVRNLNTDGSLNFTCHLYVALLTDWAGEIQETEEMKDPRMYPISDLPVHEMMQADLTWVPRILAGETFVGSLSCDPDQNLVGEPIFEHHEFDGSDMLAA